MAKSTSSARWKQRQARDPFVRKAHAEGWRSRAVFKLSELQRVEKLMRQGDVVVDLGAAPGAWSQYAASVVGASGRVVALDLLEMPPLPGVEVLQGDFREEETLKALLATLGTARVDLVLSDLAPNMSGMRSVDQPRSMYLAELVLDFAGQVLRGGGNMVVKLFQGESFQEYVNAVRTRFGSVRMRKPPASRSGNRETYLVARNFRL
ncbi:MAG: 23S rRNA (uridine(2552)-2'-O)-methyltransferase RlmE [Gammaproteobacteria bacterium]|nr:23S rRNA (uridine(2552)-2'-O)-methyltransferase RlmE [Gammaproteobacteria bacterium]